MTATRLHIETALDPGATVALPEAAVAHLRARRLRAGAPLVLFDGHGSVADARLTRLERRRGEATVEALRREDRESPLRVVLLQGVSKGERMDIVVQKATELGVEAIMPVFTDHGVVRLDAERAARKQGHWQRVAIAACEQCGRNTVPEVAAPVALADALNAVGEREGLLLDPGAELGSADLAPAASGFALLIGPEGGLSEAEHARALARGWRGLHLGPRVLRTETAALAALTALQLRLGDLG